MSRKTTAVPATEEAKAALDAMTNAKTNMATVLRRNGELEAGFKQLLSEYAALVEAFVPQNLYRYKHDVDIRAECSKKIDAARDTLRLVK